MPEAFRENNDDLRFLSINSWDFQKAYDGMLENENWLLNFQTPLFGRYEEFQPYLNEGIVYGYHRDTQNRPMFVYDLKR